MIWFALVALGFLAGLLRLPRWASVVPPAASVGVGIYAVVHEPANYDMHGFGYAVGGLVALACMAAWLLGRGLATVARVGDSR